MARFRAYASDSSDEEFVEERTYQEDPQNQVELEDEDSSQNRESLPSSSSSYMDEDELMRSPPRKKQASRNALIQDEDGEFRYAHEISADSQQLGTHRSESPPSPPRARGDPTIIPWAKQIGVDAQKMHVMQTSLFRMPEEAATLKAMNAMNTRNRNIRLLPQTVSRKHSRDSEGDGIRLDSRERASFAHDIDVLPYRPTRKYARVECSASTVIGSEGYVVDAGLAMGCSFRVGWGPGGTLAHTGALCGVHSNPKASANSSTITITKMPLFAPSPTRTDLALKLLQRHLSNSPIEPDDDGIPFANPSPTLCFSSFLDLISPSDNSYETSFFRLGHALFDPMDFHLGDSITPDIRNRVAAVRRKAALSSWLEHAVAPSIETDLRTHHTYGSAAVAFTLLTGNQVEKASEKAMDDGNYKLATMISQAGGDFDFREDLREQLDIWREQRIDIHISEDTRKVYALLAGIVDSVVESSKGSGFERCSDIDITKGLDWKRAFGLHLWFSVPLDASISEVLEAYNNLIKEPLGRQIAKPVPWYKEQLPQPPNPWNLPDELPPDGLFNLIRLHAEPPCSLSEVLNPLSFSFSPVDCILPWHTYIILSRCMRVRDFSDRGDPGTTRDVNMDDEDTDNMLVEGHSPNADLLASSYALQLERHGMIQEALFVLLHIEGSHGREKAIKDMLQRSAGRLDEWMTRGIVGSLKIPMAWVNEAKAIHEVDNGNLYDAYELYIAAGLYDAAHDIAVLDLAPDAIIRKDLDLLKELFSRFVGHTVAGWHTRGKVFLDYVHIVTRLPELQALQGENAVESTSVATEIDDLARNVTRLIGILPDVLHDHSCPRHNAALVEMTAGLMSRLDRIRPLALAQSQVQLSHVDDFIKLRHIQSTAHDKFLRSIVV